MNKKKFVCVFFACLLLFHIILVKLYQINPQAEYIYSDSGYEKNINLKGQTYKYIFDVPEPYFLVRKDDSFSFRTYFIPSNELADFIFMWSKVSYFSEDYDDDRCFLVEQPFANLYVKKGFIYPTIDKNEIDEVWMSHSSTYHIITDKATVDKIVECAKSDGEITLDKDIVEYIKEYSVDGHCLNLKYKGYPLVEKVYIEETEDGRYIIKQYTIEEFDTIYYQDEAHQ